MNLPQFHFFIKKCLPLILSSFLSSAAVAAPVCENVLQSGTLITQRTQELMGAIQSQPLLMQVILNPNEKINWETFQSLEGFKVEIYKYAEGLKTLSPEQAIQERQSLDQYLEENAWAKNLFSQIAKTQDQNQDYAPTQYHMRVRFIQELIKLIKILPPEFRPLIARPSFDRRRQNINREAEDFIRDYTKRFDVLFNQGSGYSDYAKLEKGLRNHPNPFIKKALALVDQNQIEIVIRRPKSARFWIPKVGFQNQYVTGSSKGFYGQEERNISEANITNTPLREYKDRDAEFKPKYGSMKASASAGVESSLSRTEHFGDDIYTLKLHEIENRLSFAMDDTLGAGLSATPGKIVWTDTVIPWSRRLVMVPLLASSLEKNQFYLNYFITDTIAVPLKLSNRWGHAYWETQIFGPISLDLVQSFQFGIEPPAGEFLQELLKRKITIYDGRKFPPELWTP